MIAEMNGRFIMQFALYMHIICATQHKTLDTFPLISLYLPNLALYVSKFAVQRVQTALV